MSDEYNHDKYRALAIFTDGKLWDKDRYIKLAREALEQHALMGIQVGKYLIVLKEMLPKSEFVGTSRQIGLERSAAYRYMQIAARFSGLSEETVGDLGVSKLYKMLAAPAQETDRFESEGEFLDMTKEEVVSISVRELDRRIKEARQKDKDDISDKDARLEVLYEENRQLQKNNEDLQYQVGAVKQGAKHKDALPDWWLYYTSATTALSELAEHLPSEPPNFDKDQLYTQRCVNIARDLRNYLDRCLEKLVPWHKKANQWADENGNFDMKRYMKEHGHDEYEEEENG